MNLWTSEDIAKILIQLNEMELPFSKYALCQEKGELKLLGRGGSAEVYEAESRSSHKHNFAMKVIGFRNQNIDSTYFKESVQVQKDIGDYQNYVVKIYDHVEIWVTLDDKDNVVSVAKERPEKLSRTTLKLQFVLMEKMSCVIKRTKGANLKMMPEGVAHGDEQEILKLAYDIGQALKMAHNKNVLHRDVKLENVFYSEKKKQYKLGDFGIAKKTKDGFAETIAFTKGYAAPEVRISDERYDNTADIYSFGMMLYVLANNLKFPDSNTYNVNFSMQYESGYIVPEPESGISDGLYKVIAKACMYDANKRYQSMEELLLDIEKLMYDESLGYKKENKNSSLVAGIIMLVFGVASWKLTMAPSRIINFSLCEYIFLAGCLGKGVLKALKKDMSALSIGLLMIGIYLMFKSGFSWAKLIILLWMTFSSGAGAGYLALSALIANFISLIQRTSGIEAYAYNEYSWVAITVISIALVLLYQYELLVMEDRKTAKIYYKKGLYWKVVIAIYTIEVFQGLLEKQASSTSFDHKMVGIYGLGFCLFWMGRERLLRIKQKSR